MSFRKTPAFDAPIPGQSLTSEPKNRPWRNPPQLDTVEDAMEYYFPKLSDPNFAPRLLDVMERGIPLTSLAEVIVTGGAMEGIHSIDVGMLVAPILVEFMKGMADIAQVKYTLGDEDKNEQPDELMLEYAMNELKKSKEIIEDISDEKEVQEPQELPKKGIMERRESM